MSTESRERAWVEVDPSALRGNLATIRATAAEGVRLVPMVKADAYGVGLAGAVEALGRESPWGFGVATVPEGIGIRKLGVDLPVLVVSPVPPAHVRPGVASGLTLCVSEVGALRTIAAEADALGVTATVHLEIDTGMGRSGFDWRSVDSWGPEVDGLTRGAVRWEGVFTHFHSADQPDPGSVQEQAGRFHDALAVLRRLGERDWILHLCNSAGALRRPELAAGLARPGIFLYGGRAGEGLPDPREVVSVRARIGLVREVPAGTTLGYGATYRASRRERWATVTIGYGDGLPRALGNLGSGLLRGHRVPIIGRISMDLTVVDTSDVPAVGLDVGEEVTFIGTDGGERISLEEVAGLAGTISYEVLTGLTSRLPRVWSARG